MPLPPRRSVPAVIVLVCAVAGLVSAGPAQAARCTTSGPGSGAFTVTVCLVAPAPDAAVDGDTVVSATVSLSGTTRQIRTMTFWLDSEYILTDYQAPWSFVLPTADWPNGVKTLKAQAALKGKPSFRTTKTSIDLAFANGVSASTVDPFSPRTAEPADGEPLVIAGVGDGANGRSAAASVVNRMASWNPDLVLYLGDVYGRGSGAEFRNYFAPAPSAYGRFRAITNPVPGNHEYEMSSTAAPYFSYWGAPPHSYSYDAGGWHFVALDSTEEFGQTLPGSVQYEWLRDDLRNSGDCSLVSLHHPVWTRNAPSPDPRLLPLWRLLDREGVDLVVTGHAHNYARWKPLDGDGSPGVGNPTQITVGTGGHFLYPFVRDDVRVASSNDKKHGALRVELSPGSAAYSFVAIGGATLDQGSRTCSPEIDHDAPRAPALTATPVGATEMHLSWTAATDDIGVVSYRVLRDGAEIATVDASTLTLADTDLVPDTAYAYAVEAFDASGKATASDEIVQTTPPDTSSPSIPGGATAELTDPTTATLRWDAASDDVGVTGYEVVRDGVPLDTVQGTSFDDSGLTADTTYTYEIRARDAAGNRSEPATAQVTTPPADPPPSPSAIIAARSG